MMRQWVCNAHAPDMVLRQSVPCTELHEAMGGKHLKPALAA